MKHRDGSGFTLVELIITMVVMAALMALGTVAVTGLQKQARDKERESDIETLARGLEARYANGNPRAESDDDFTKKGIYPGINEMIHAMGNERSNFTPTIISGGYMTDLLPGTTEASYTSPGLADALHLICTYACAPAGNQAQLTAAFGGQDKYIYEPVDTGGTICCCGDCYGFNLYWKDESGTIHKVKSKHQ